MYTLICKIYTLICKICTFSPRNRDGLVSLRVALTVLYHVDSLVNVVVRLSSLIEIYYKSFNKCSHIGLQLPSSRKTVHKNICIWRERERERERERALAEYHVKQGSRENPSRNMCTDIL